jgi:hypothetical protein
MSVTRDHTLIPAPPLVRARLAANYREARLLRSLLRISLKDAEERHRQAASMNGVAPSAAITPAKRGTNNGH